VNFSIVLTALVLLLASIGIVHYRDDSFPFRCTNFSRYDLTLKERERLVFAVTQDLRFQNHHSGYLLLNGKVTSGEVTTLLNRRINLITGDKIDYDTYRGNDSKLLIVFYVQIMPDDFIMQLHRF